MVDFQNGIDGVSMIGHLGFDWTAPLSHHVLFVMVEIVGWCIRERNRNRGYVEHMNVFPWCPRCDLV